MSAAIVATGYAAPMPAMRRPSPALITAGPTAMTGGWSECRGSRKPITASWSGSIGVSIRWPSSTITRGCSLPPSTPDAPPLREYLGEMTWYLDAFFDRREGGIEVIGGMHKWVMPCNWKFPAENFGGDSYHVQWSHLSAVKTNFSLGAATKPETAIPSCPAAGWARYVELDDIMAVLG